MNFVKFGNNAAFKFDGVDTINQDPLTGINSFSRNTTSPDYEHTIYEGSDESYEKLEDIATGNASTVGQIVSSMNRQYKDGATGNTFGDALSDTYQIQNNGTTIFKVFNNGRIGTNQLKAPVVRATQAYEIPIYDAAGTLHGYIKVFT